VPGQAIKSTSLENGRRLTSIEAAGGSAVNLSQPQCGKSRMTVFGQFHGRTLTALRFQVTNERRKESIMGGRLVLSRKRSETIHVQTGRGKTLERLNRAVESLVTRLSDSNLDDAFNDEIHLIGDLLARLNQEEVVVQLVKPGNQVRIGIFGASGIPIVRGELLTREAEAVGG